MLLQVGVKYGGEDIPGSPFPMSSNPSLDDVTSGSPEKMRNNKTGEDFPITMETEIIELNEIDAEIMTIYLQVCKIERGANCLVLESQSIQMLKT